MAFCRGELCCPSWLPLEGKAFNNKISLKFYKKIPINIHNI